MQISDNRNVTVLCKQYFLELDFYIKCYILSRLKQCLKFCSVFIAKGQTFPQNSFIHLKKHFVQINFMQIILEPQVRWKCDKNIVLSQKIKTFTRFEIFIDK